MSLKRRLHKVEETWYTLEGEYYAAHWQELYEQDNAAEALRERLVELVDATNPPFWFLVGKEDWERRFCWALRDSQPAITLFNQMHDRLKKFVDGQTLDADVPKRNRPNDAC